MSTSSLAIIADGGDTVATSPTGDYRGIAEPLRHVAAWRDARYDAHERFVVEIDERDRVGLRIVDETPGDATPIALHGETVLRFTIDPDRAHHGGEVLDVDAIEAELGADGAIAVLIDRVIAGSELERGADGPARVLDTGAREAADALDTLLADRRWFADGWAVREVGDWVGSRLDITLAHLGLGDLDREPDQTHVDRLRELGRAEGVILGNDDDDIRFFLEETVADKRVERIARLGRQVVCVHDALELLRLAEARALRDRVDLRGLDDVGPDPRDAHSRVPDTIVSWEWDGVSGINRVIPNDGGKWHIE